jgi:hypothetical protein
MGHAIYYDEGTPVVAFKIHTTDGRVIDRELQIGRDTGEWAYDRKDVRAVIKYKRPQVVEVWQEADYQGNRYLAHLKFERNQVRRIEMKYLLPAAVLAIVRASLFDSVTGQSTTLDGMSLPQERWAKIAAFDQVEVYENLHVLPRAWFVKRVLTAPRVDVLQAIKTGRLKDGSQFDPKEIALMEREDFGSREIKAPAVDLSTDATVNVARYDPHAIELNTHNAHPGFLVLSEIYYRGWEATVDGNRVPVERVNYTLRGIQLPPGDHKVEFVFRAHSFRVGTIYSSLGIVLLLTGGLLSRPRGQRFVSRIKNRKRS